MDHLLVGVDGSPDSLVALRWAGWFAAATGSTIDLAYAWQYGRRLEPVFETPHTEVEELEADVFTVLRRLADRELDDPSLVDRCIPLRGPVAPALLEEAARSRAGLIVVGARGTGGALRILLGSVSRELTTWPTHAVAVVPEDERHHDPGDRPILVGVDGSDGAARAVRWAGEAARRVGPGAEVIAVHAYQSPIPEPSTEEDRSLSDERRDRLVQEWCAPLRAMEVRHRPVLARGEPVEVIQHLADVDRPLCGVFGSRGLGAISQVVLGSTTGHLVRELPWPVVVIPSARDRAIWPPWSTQRGPAQGPEPDPVP